MDMRLPIGKAMVDFGARRLVLPELGVEIALDGWETSSIAAAVVTRLGGKKPEQRRTPARREMTKRMRKRHDARRAGQRDELLSLMRDGRAYTCPELAGRMDLSGIATRALLMELVEAGRAHKACVAGPPTTRYALTMEAARLASEGSRDRIAASGARAGRLQIVAGGR